MLDPIRGMFDKYPEKFYKLITREGILMKLGKFVDANMLSVIMYNLFITRQLSFSDSDWLRARRI